jgi:hypothetical protein
MKAIFFFGGLFLVAGNGNIWIALGIFLILLAFVD